MPAMPPHRAPGPQALRRLPLAVPVLLLLLAGLAGGLVRAGVPMPPPLAGDWLGPAVAQHAFLMICAFMGTVIGIERAVAVKHALAFAGPLASAAAGGLLLAGGDEAARWLAAAAALAFVAVNLVVVQRQRAAHTALLLVGALAWAAGNLLHALGLPPGSVVPWWFAFLVLTIAAERLEMTRLMRRRPGASAALHGLTGGLLLACALTAFTPVWGGVLYGLGLLGLAMWLAAFDVARRTVRAGGLSRYMAVCLLLGYAWLAIAGAAWIAMALGQPTRDAALHALALGFVFSMVLGHAPVILPALARVKVLYGWPYYLPLALLHGSLLLRLAAVPFGVPTLAAGAAANALAVVAFLATVAGSAIAWQRRAALAPRRPGRGGAVDA